MARKNHSPGQGLDARGRRQALHNTNNGPGRLAKKEKSSESLAEFIPFWKNLDILTRYQKSVWDNLAPSWMENWQSLFRLAPQHLWQSILPWSFSAFQFTNEIQGDPEMEYKILTRVAGYGSQLGTIMDFLEVAAKRIKPDLRKGQTNADEFKVLKFYDLLDKIDRAKGRPEVAVD
jgi:hypothetical protein